MLISKDTLANFFGGDYDRDAWLTILAEIFQGKDTFYNEPSSITAREVDSLSLLGYVETSDDNPRKLGVYEVKTSSRTRLARNRIQMRKIVADDCQKKDFDGALAVYHNDETPELWRFSFISIEHTIDSEGKVQKNETSTKRFTYILGRSAQIRVATNRFNNLPLKPALSDLQAAFAVEPLNKEFYDELYAWYERAISEVKFPNGELIDPGNNVATSLIRFITRLLFVWFIKEKGLVNLRFFDLEELSQIIHWDKPSSYYKAILQNLFFATLNREIYDREFRAWEDNEREAPGDDTGIDKQYSQNYGIKSLYRYQEYFIESDTKKIIKLFESTPFLNGGLFDCLDRDATDEEVKEFNHGQATRTERWRVRIDGFSDRKDNVLYVPNDLFYTGNEDGSGLIEILKRYQFTVDESSAVDSEVALDPELMGTIFENLLASYNPETEETAKKSTGSFYTPRTIVAFMVDNSLKAYLSQVINHIPQYEKMINKLFDDAINEFDDEATKNIIQAIDDIQVLDPAVGSGAFPMGILQRLIDLLEVLDPENQKFMAQQIASAREIPDQLSREKSIQEIEQVFSEGNFYNNYGRKLYLIRKAIFGVDIQPLACQISKLRFFISLAIEQNVTNNPDENYGLRPLPNLETRFVSADTLIKLDFETQRSFADIDPQELIKEIEKIRQQYFSAKTIEEKAKCQEEDKLFRQELVVALEDNGCNFETARKIADWNPYDQNASAANWFDPKYMFGIQDGFDIVIGNPPYIQLQANGGELAKRFKSLNFKVFMASSDIYALFYEKGIDLLKPNGHLCYITSNKWMRAKYGEKLREELSKYELLLLVDLGSGVFNAAVDTCILILRKNMMTRDGFMGITINDVGSKELSQLDNLQLVDLSDLKSICDKPWFIGTFDESMLKKKIEEIGMPLKEWDISIYRGILTGYNNAFILDNETKNALIEEDPKSVEIIKPILRGKDIDKYSVSRQCKWLIAAHNGYGNIPRIDIEEYSALKKHLDKFYLVIAKRNDQGDTPYNLRACSYYGDFMQDKIVYPNMTSKLCFALDTNNMLANQKCFIATGNHLGYIAAVLNSNLAKFWMKRSCAKLGNDGYELSKIFMQEFPLYTADENNIRELESLINSILQIKPEKIVEMVQVYENKINRIVYNLYQLTDDQIAIIEDDL